MNFSRRAFTIGLAANASLFSRKSRNASAAPAARRKATENQQTGGFTYVLVHGAWHGSWCWKRIRTALQARGHAVFTPTSTGLADREHLLSPAVNLKTHITDVVNLITWEELSNVVLCGHSYGGCVISGVADRVPERIGALVYLDPFVLEDGESLYDTIPSKVREAQLESARERGGVGKCRHLPRNVSASTPRMRHG